MLLLLPESPPHLSWPQEAATGTESERQRHLTPKLLCTSLGRKQISVPLNNNMDLNAGAGSPSPVL